MPPVPPDLLRDIIARQLSLQRDHFQDPTLLTPEERAEFVRWNVLALEDELHEAMQEVGWKPWATTRHLNREEYVNELVDALHFLVNLFLVADVSASEVWDRFVKKNDKNRRRQEEGYTGVKDENGREID